MSAAQVCDWCGSPMSKHSRIVTSFWAGKGDIWLCNKPGCGHEREVPDPPERTWTLAELQAEKPRGAVLIRQGSGPLMSAFICHGSGRGRPTGAHSGKALSVRGCAACSGRRSGAFSLPRFARARANSTGLDGAAGLSIQSPAMAGHRQGLGCPECSGMAMHTSDCKRRDDPLRQVSADLVAEIMSDALDVPPRLASGGVPVGTPGVGGSDVPDCPPHQPGSPFGPQ